MTGAQQRRAWIWMAIVTIVLSTATSAQSGLQSARSYATPVIQLIAATQHAQASAASETRSSYLRSARQTNAGDNNLWAAMLPVLFIGLIAPLSLIGAGSIQSLGRAPAAPALAALFQRPPPAFLL